MLQHMLFSGLLIILKVFNILFAIIIMDDSLALGV